MNRVAVIGLVGGSAFLSIDSFLPVGDTMKADSFHFEMGGKGFNQALAAARAGAEVSFLAAIGEEYQEEVLAFCERENIRVFLAKKKEKSAFASILTDKTGANSVTVYQGPRLEEDDLATFYDAVRESDVLLLNHEVPQEINSIACAFAKANNTYVIVNPAPSREIGSDILNSADLFTPNEHEAPSIGNTPRALVTLGKAGCLNRMNGRTYPALPIEKAVDTTGAGDTFNGYLAAAIAKNKTMDEAIEEAICAAGVSVLSPYAAGSIPTREKVDEYLLS